VMGLLDIDYVGLFGGGEERRGVGGRGVEI
jgi:hypothetical protein